MKLIQISLIASLSLLCLLSAAQAAEVTGNLFKIELGTDLRYDDLAVYVVDQSTVPATVSKKGDFFVEPYLTLSYKTRAALPTKLVFDFTTDFYSTYSVLNHQTYRFIIEQKIAPKTYLTLRYTLIPKFFFGDDIVQSTSTVPTNDQAYQVHLWQITADRDFTPNLNLALFGKYGIRDARPAFNYRDVNLWSAGMDGTYRLSPKTKWILGASYERDNAAGGTNAFTSNPDDATYDQYVIYTSLAYSISDAWTIKGRFSHRERSYTTNLTGDTLHNSRRDHTNDILLGTTYKLTKALSLKADYEGIWRDSTKSYAQFQENIYTLGINYLF